MESKMKLVFLILVFFSTAAWAQRTNFVVVERDAFCSQTQHNLIFTARPKFEQVEVVWRPVADVSQHCSSQHSIACAFVEQKQDRIVCTVYTRETLNLAILGHEIRHCFELDWHR